MKKFLIYLLIFLLISGIAAGVAGLLLGIIPAPGFLKKNKTVGKYFPSKPKVDISEYTRKKEPTVDPQAQLIKTLHSRIAQQEKRIARDQDEMDKLTGERDRLKNELTQIKEALNAKNQEVDQANGQKMGYAKMAQYYNSMDKNKAAKIMAELDDETVIGILQNLPADTASSILGVMEPQRAAVITRKMIQ